ncbi:MAG TPA: hypothetical protein VGG75_38345 [Trebonia sp.]|jgi:hypothetical protein
MAEVNLDAVAMDWLLNDPAGPVGVLIADMSEKAAAIARTAAPVMVTGSRWPPSNFSHWGKAFNPRFQYGDTGPGDTRASVRWSGFLYNGLGQMYSGVNVNYGPTLYLQQGGGRHGHAIRHPFMTTALDTVQL